MSETRTIPSHFLSLTAPNAASKVTGLFIVIYLARVLGPGDFGRINFAMALISYFAMMAHLCVNTIGTRDISQDPEGVNGAADRILSLKLMLGAAAFLLLAARAHRRAREEYEPEKSLLSAVRRAFAALEEPLPPVDYGGIYLSPAFKRKAVNSLTFAFLIMLRRGRLQAAFETAPLLFRYGPHAFAAGAAGGVLRAVSLLTGRGPALGAKKK